MDENPYASPVCTETKLAAPDEAQVANAPLVAYYLVTPRSIRRGVEAYLTAVNIGEGTGMAIFLGGMLITATLTATVFAEAFLVSGMGISLCLAFLGRSLRRRNLGRQLVERLATLLQIRGGEYVRFEVDQHFCSVQMSPGGQHRWHLSRLTFYNGTVIPIVISPEQVVLPFPREADCSLRLPDFFAELRKRVENRKRSLTPLGRLVRRLMIYWLRRRRRGKAT